MKIVLFALMFAAATPILAAPASATPAPEKASPHAPAASTAAPPAALPPSHLPGYAASAPGQTQPPVNAESLPNSGKVLAVIDTDLYTYVEVSNNGRLMWLATTKTSVVKGDTIRYGQGATINNFTSRALNRTFPSIIFIDRIAPVKAGT